jgi:hypothetical protein
MALIAVLEFGDNSIRRYTKQYLLSDCRFVFDRPYNAFSPERPAHCERIEVVVIAPGKSDLGLFQWFSEQENREGRIAISLISDVAQNETEPQVVYFENGRCLSLSEMYDIDNSSRRLIKLAIISDKIEIEDVEFNCL